MLNQETNQPQKSQTQAKGNPLAETIREGAIAANIFTGTGKDGSTYHYFALSRSWKNNEGQSGYSGSFYAKNSEALNRVILAAAEKCEQLDSTSRKKNAN